MVFRGAPAVPVLDKDREAQAVRQITEYGQALFAQVFGGAASFRYRSLRERSFDGCRVEIGGSAGCTGCTGRRCGIRIQLGMVAEEQRRFAEAEASYRQALDIRQESGPRAASSTASQLGTVLSQLGQHSEATAVLLYAAATWRQETGQWEPKDLQLLNQERAQLEPTEFSKLVQANLPADIRDEFAAAIEA